MRLEQVIGIPQSKTYIGGLRGRSCTFSSTGDGAPEKVWNSLLAQVRVVWGWVAGGTSPGTAPTRWEMLNIQAHLFGQKAITQWIGDFA